jgi:hypothetical protein
MSNSKLNNISTTKRDKKITSLVSHDLKKSKKIVQSLIVKCVEKKNLIPKLECGTDCKHKF